MATFSQGDVVRVPFPYADKDTRQHRPALVVSLSRVGEDNALLWVAMITSAENRAWRKDVPIRKFEKAGLPVVSVVRTRKLATIEARHADRVGTIDKTTPASVLSHIRATVFGATASP